MSAGYTPPDPWEMVHPSWNEPLAPVRQRIDDTLRALAREDYLPDTAWVLRALSVPFDQVKVLILGQDPYPTPGHAMGLAFSVAPEVRPVPRSLGNIYQELHADVGCAIPQSGDLTPWVRQGVMLLNSVLTVLPGKPASHRRRGWEEVTEHIVKSLAARQVPLVSILWGRDAQAKGKWVEEYPIIASPHPSPLSARRGFFGSRPFSRANELLREQGASPVNWDLQAN